MLQSGHWATRNPGHQAMVNRRVERRGQLVVSCGGGLIEVANAAVPTLATRSAESSFQMFFRNAANGC
jgi:hypothetical protein